MWTVCPWRKKKKRLGQCNVHWCCTEVLAHTKQSTHAQWESWCQLSSSRSDSLSDYSRCPELPSPSFFSPFIFSHYPFISENLPLFGCVKLSDCLFFFPFLLFFPPVCCSAVLALTADLLNLHSHLPSGKQTHPSLSSFLLLVCVPCKYEIAMNVCFFFFFPPSH